MQREIPKAAGTGAQPGFHHEARYEFRVHLGGAEFETLTYRVTFGEIDGQGRQSVELRSLAEDDAREDTAVGELLLLGWYVTTG